MKILNKIISALCIMALLISAVPAYAQASPTLYFTNPTLTAGGSSAYCYLKMDNAENISAMDYRILYDAENIELDSMYKTGFTNQSDVTVSVNTSEPGVIHVTLISQNGLNGNNYVHLMYFKAKKSAKPGTYPISVLVTDIYNSSLDTVVATTQKGTITIKEGTQTVKNISFSSTVSPSSLKVGETVNYKLSASSLNNLSAGTFDFTYDQTKLKFNGATLSSAMQNTVCDINDSIDGLVKISFASEKAITSGTNLVTLNFSSIAPGTASIALKPSDLYDSSFVGMTGNELTKSVTITEPEVVIDYPDFKFLIPEDVPSDKEFTVKAVLEGGSGVRAGDFVVNYNSNVLECTGLNSESISGAWIVTDKNYSNGQIRFSLMSNVDLTEDTALVSMKFKARENVDSKSKLTATGTGINDVKFNVVTLEFVDSEIEVVRPEYTVTFYDSDGTTLLAKQNVMSGNRAIPPKTEQIRKSDDYNHLKFSGWDKDYSVITDNVNLVAVYENEVHTVITQSAVGATCTETGLTEGKYCVVCNEILAKQEVIPEKGHNEVVTPDIKPGVSTPGYTGGTHCDVCGKVLVEPEVIPPTGIIVNAVLNSDGKLTVEGVLSSNAATEGTTLIAVYNGVGQFLKTVDITALNQTEFEIEIPDCIGARYIKIMRWDMATLKPFCDVIKVDIVVYPNINAVFDDGTLRVSGAVTEKSETEGTTFLAVYNKDNRMLTLANITALDQSDFSISIENMKDAHTVKVLRWAMPSLSPLHNAVAVNVTSK